MSCVRSGPGARVGVACSLPLPLHLFSLLLLPSSLPHSHPPLVLGAAPYSAAGGGACLLEGYTQKLNMATPLLTFWQKRYIKLFQGRLEWCDAPYVSDGGGSRGRDVVGCTVYVPTYLHSHPYSSSPVPPFPPHLHYHCRKRMVTDHAPFTSAYVA